MAQKLSYKFDSSKAIKKVITDSMIHLEIPYKHLKLGEIQLSRALPPQIKVDLQKNLHEYGITLIEDKKEREVQQIRDVITELIHNSDGKEKVKTSTYLESKLHKSYSSIAKLFKEYTFTSIENFIILQKIERAKELMLAKQHSLTEIAYLLGYSSVAHLSNQFKKTTGLSASTFLRILRKRAENDQA